MSYFKNRLNAFKFAFHGMAHFFTNEAHAKVHVLATIIAIGAGIYFDINRADWLWISLAIGIVFITEMVNSSIERMVDLHSKEKSTLAKQAKDLGAGAVFVAAIFAIVVAVLVFQPYL